MGMKDCMLKVCPCCKEKSPHLVFSIVGLSVSFTELILASIYNYHACGFALAFLGLITSGLYLFFSYREVLEKRKDRKAQDAESLLN